MSTDWTPPAEAVEAATRAMGDVALAAFNAGRSQPTDNLLARRALTAAHPAIMAAERRRLMPTPDHRKGWCWLCTHAVTESACAECGCLDHFPPWPPVGQRVQCHVQTCVDHIEGMHVDVRGDAVVHLGCQFCAGGVTAYPAIVAEKDAGRNVVRVRVAHVDERDELVKQRDEALRKLAAVKALAERIKPDESASKRHRMTTYVTYDDLRGVLADGDRDD